MIYFVGAGSGAVDLITVRGAEILRKAGVIIYAGSLVNPEILSAYANENCEVYDSARMTLEEITQKLVDGHERNLVTVRLHSGDPSIFGAIREQINFLCEKNIPFEIVPGVSSLCSSAAALKTEFMTPEKSQTLIISRLDGRTGVPENESLKNLAGIGASTAIFLSAGMCDRVCDELIAGGFSPETPAAVVYKASWPDEKILRGNLKNLPELVRQNDISKTAIIFAGDFLLNENDCAKSKLYDKNFSHEYRKK